MEAGPSTAYKEDDAITIHATCVAYDGRAALILGAAGSGKSSLALQMMAYGAALVADDQTVLTVQSGTLLASPPPTIKGLIEARGVGLLKAANVTNVHVTVAVDMDREEMQRLPSRHMLTLAGVEVPCLHKVDSPHFPAAILQYLKGGRRDP
ncbi:HPr kinase/phosphorylase [uncultured Roseobacter sp.]|uniref:HPr kinase/phosphorylase n=1 Tax=uncultured Roseobacter sp. TaxID=114847 RepID=UPI0026239A16|nr:HPr kinase/phosphatase C-terminal domain-containing protein [uncultured Roseobacter sp.]